MLAVIFDGGPFDGSRQNFDRLEIELPTDVVRLVSNGTLRSVENGNRSRHSRITSVAVYTLSQKMQRPCYKYCGSISAMDFIRALDKPAPLDRQG